MSGLIEHLQPRPDITHNLYIDRGARFSFPMLRDLTNSPDFLLLDWRNGLKKPILFRLAVKSFEPEWPEQSVATAVHQPLAHWVDGLSTVRDMLNETENKGLVLEVVGRKKISPRKPYFIRDIRVREGIERVVVYKIIATG